jgi:isoquinoline 1-oxidoreductase subunit beta
MNDSIVSRSHLSRRHFLVLAAGVTGGLVVGFRPEAASAAHVGPAPWDGALNGASEVNPWIAIGTDNSVIMRLGQSEMGQGVMTGLPMILAEELQCDWSSIRVEMASGNRNLRENNVYKRLSTGGSGAVRRSREFLQQAGANARERLIAAAAKQWDVATSECEAKSGFVIHAASNRKAPFGTLAADAAEITLTSEPKIKSPDRYTLIGTSPRRLDTPLKINGSAIYGIDVKVPDMLYAAVKVCPVFGGTLKSFDATKALARRGVIKVMPIPNGIAVVADRFWRAKEALALITLDWDYGEASTASSAEFREAYRDALDGKAVNAKKEGDPDAAYANAATHIEALYEAPHLAHAAMEPLNCTAHVTSDRAEIWMGTQNPDAAIQLAAKTLGLPPQSIIVHTTFLGGGFGRRAVNDELAQAVVIAKELGKPVKVLWTREEDMQQDRYRPQAAIRFQAALDTDGKPIVFKAKTAVGSISRSLGWNKVENGLEPSAVEGLANLPYLIPHQSVDCILKNTHVPVMFWRSVGSSQNAFAVESFIDELALAAKADPMAFRRQLLADNPDFLHVLDVLAEKSDWSKPMPERSGRGISIHESFGTIVGEVIEASVSKSGEIRVERVVAAVDCGHVVHPDQVKAQIESGIVYGLSAALYGEISVKNGRIEQSNFDSYPVVRQADCPTIEVHLALSGGDKWGGIGEPGTPPVAPALANAVFAATGKRIRSLPMQPALLNSGV